MPCVDNDGGVHSDEPARDDQAMLRAWLQTHDEPCPRCRYNLRGLIGVRCPECDAAITLGVRSPDLVMLWFIATLIGISLALGFDGVMSVLIVVESLRSNPPPDRFYIFFFASTAALGTTIAVLLRKRVWFQKQRLSLQRAAVFASWLGLFAVHVVFLGRVLLWW